MIYTAYVFEISGAYNIVKTEIFVDAKFNNVFPVIGLKIGTGVRQPDRHVFNDTTPFTIMCRGIIMLVLPRENNRYRETKNV